jgi:catechol 2,3-dioxygenase-like lactoylglutathione lyase family enzyme
LTLAARLDAAGVAVKREPATLADERCVAGLISFADPAGNRLEASHGAHIADSTFKPSRDVSGFRTGPQGMGHTLLTLPDIDAALAFYKDLLGFRISDFMVAPLKAYFMHVNARHHSVALVEAPVRSMHHLLVEYYQLDDVGQGYDPLQYPGENRRHARPPSERPDDVVVLHAHPVRDLCRVRLGRQRGRGHNTASGNDQRGQLLRPQGPI